MLVRCTEHSFDTVLGPRTAVVVTPAEHVRVGRDRLEQLRRDHSGGDIDREVLEHVRAREGQDQLVVFSAASGDGSGSWGFDGELTEDERLELGYHLVTDELPTYRRMVAAGVFALLHVSWGEDEVRAYEEGTRRLLAELEAGSVPETDPIDPGEAAVHRADRWILSNLTFFFARPLEDVIQGVLAKQMPLFEERIPHFREMVDSLPPPALA